MGPKRDIVVSNHEDVVKLIDPTHFRVSIFGSARVHKEDVVYKQVYDFAKIMADEGIDIVTGGGPGLMEAANAGHAAGDPTNQAQSIGLTVRLPSEAVGNQYLEIEKHFNKFSNRLDTFVSISHAAVIMLGGIGTCLEFFYVWQLIQVKHIYQMPIILIGEQWEGLLDWIIKYPLKSKFMNKEDLDMIHVVKTNEEAANIIKKTYAAYRLIGKDRLSLNTQKYSADQEPDLK
ncbi:MAG: hypothetical protein UT05_C0001G0090 [Parcubacteria group bacterium GW2011_GWF2_38_76]|nr:MAG: hypothetical protein UT05_C0001G0090 [Parcubacteria group bacterium GW2011_GWF2_38_76]HBM45934.1 LOG family protein [Patescibacteria group bacterium]